MTSTEICSYKGLVQRHQADRADALRADAVASMAADAVQAFLATRGAAAGAPGEGAAAVPVLGIALERGGSAPIQVGEVVQAWIQPPTPPEAKELAVRLAGPRGTAWKARIQLGSAVPGAPREAAAPAEAPLPPLRLMRPMRRSDGDQAGHVNVQVFLDLVDDAVGVLCLEALPGAPRLQITRARVSFRQELFEGDVVGVHSGILRADAEGLDLVHGIVHQPSGRVACVVETRVAALDASGLPVAGAAALRVAQGEPVGDWPALPLARPPALPRAPQEPVAQAVATSLSVVDAWDADAAGFLSMRSMIDLCSTGARQYLATLGLTGPRFLRERITVAAVDYLLEVRQRPALGCNLTLRSAYLSGSAKSIRFVHHILGSDDGVVYATVEIVGVMLDLATHRSMEVPRDVRQRLGLATD